jgi:hypothetical protein
VVKYNRFSFCLPSFQNHFIRVDMGGPWGREPIQPFHRYYRFTLCFGGKICNATAATAARRLMSGGGGGGGSSGEADGGQCKMNQFCKDVFVRVMYVYACVL